MYPYSRSQVGKLLPQIAGHFIQQRTLSVDHFIVGKGKHEILGERVQHGERHSIVVIFPVNRVLLEITQRVVHPAHIPLQAEAQPAHIRRTRNHRPGGGLFRDGQHAGMPRVHYFVQPFYERDGRQIFAAAEFVGNPFALAPGVIQIQHGRHRVHAQPVDVIFVDPE